MKKHLPTVERKNSFFTGRNPQGTRRGNILLQLVGGDGSDTGQKTRNVRESLFHKSTKQIPNLNSRQVPQSYFVALAFLRISALNLSTILLPPQSPVDQWNHQKMTFFPHYFDSEWMSLLHNFLGFLFICFCELLAFLFLHLILDLLRLTI